MRAKGMGAKVTVTEVDHIKALEAVMDGFEVMKIEDAAKLGDIFVSATGDKHVISLDVIKLLKDGAVIAIPDILMLKSIWQVWKRQPRLKEN